MPFYKGALCCQLIHLFSKGPFAQTPCTSHSLYRFLSRTSAGAFRLCYVILIQYEFLFCRSWSGTRGLKGQPWLMKANVDSQTQGWRCREFILCCECLCFVDLSCSRVNSSTSYLGFKNSTLGAALLKEYKSIRRALQGQPKGQSSPAASCLQQWPARCFQEAPKQCRQLRNSPVCPLATAVQIRTASVPRGCI